MSRSLHESFGGLSLPVLAADVDTTLAPLDPGRDTLLALFAAAINAELGAAYRKIVALLPSGHGIDRTNPVADTFPGAPTPQVMTERKAVFPLLALHRSGTGTYEPHTLETYRLIQPWELHYILGPLDVADNRKLQDICVAAAKIVRRTISRGGHPAYLDGALVFFGTDPAVATFGNLELKSHEGPGFASFAGDNASYYAITMNLESVEYSGEDAEVTVGPLTGASYDYGTGSFDGVIPNLMMSETEHPGT